MSRFSKQMHVLLSILVALAMLVPAAVTPITANATGVQYYRTITVDHTKVPNTDQTNFPVLVSLSDNTLKTVANSGHVAQDNGSDIYFTDSTGTVLAYEIEKYDGSSGTLVAWVKIPLLSCTTDTIIKMYYGGDIVTHAASDTWDVNFKGVWHMTQTSPLDSTSNGNNGAAQGTGTLSATDGKIDGALNFPGNNTPAYISCGNSEYLYFNTGNSYTWSAWINPTSQNGGSGVFEKKTAGQDAAGQGYAINIGGTPTLRFQSTSDSSKQVASTGLANFGQWTQITVTYSNTSVQMYVNGNPDTNGTITSADDIVNNFFIGRRSASEDQGYFLGTIDEARFSTVVRNADWIKTEYNNQNAPGSFCLVGAEEGGPTDDVAPEVSSQPANQSVYVGQTATFTAAASGKPVPGVQWQVSTDSGSTWNDISDATNTTLELPSVTLTQNGYQYRAVFTNTLGSDISSAASLTVSPAPPTAPSWPADAYLRAYNVGTADKPEVRFEWSRPTDGTNGGEVWGYTVLADYVTPPDMHIDSVNPGDQTQFQDFTNRKYIWSTDNSLLHIGGYGTFNAWPEVNKNYYFSMMARNWADDLHAKGPIVKFNTLFSTMMYAYQNANEPNGNRTILSYPPSTVSYVEASNSGKQTVYQVVKDPVDPQNAWFEIARTGGTNPGWTVAAGAVDPHWTLTDKATGTVIPLTPNLIGVSMLGSGDAANYWNSTTGTFYSYMNSSTGYKYWQVHVTYSGLANSTTTLEPNHTYVLSLTGPWSALYIPDGYIYSWEFTTAQADKVAPSWPAGSALTVSDVTPKTATLSWPSAVDNVGVTSYKIYRNGTLAGTVTGSSSLNTYVDTGLTPGSTYNWYVVALDYLGNVSSQRTAGPITTPVDTAAPTWPNGPTLMAINIQAASLDLLWAAALDNYPIAGYRIYQGDALIATVEGNVLNYHVTGLTPGSSNSFTVQAGDESDNWSTTGPTISVGTGTDTTAPAWPNGSTPTVTAITSTSITLSWPVATDNNKVDHYEVFANGSLAATVAAPTTTATLTGLAYDTGYDIQVIAIDPAGNRGPGTLINQVTSHALEAAFTADKTSGTAPLTINFTDQSTLTPTAWSWDFDNDGTVDSTIQNPVYTYPAPGAYTVKLTATNAVGSNTVIKTDYITVTGAPTADFSVNFTSGTVPLTVNFTDQSTGNPTAWAWDFDNDDTVDSTMRNPSYTYNAPGSYTVKLTATNTAGSDDEIKTGYITVAAAEAPVAAFTADVTTSKAPLTVNFTDQSTNTPTAWAWDFDNDGAVDSTIRNPSHTYSAVGTYTVKLTASNAAGSDDEIKTDYIIVSMPQTPVAAFTADVTSGRAPLTVNFADQSTRKPAAWAWDFNNDGTIDSTGQNPTYIFPSVGTYTVKLTVTNLSGSDDEVKTDYITVQNNWYVDAAGGGDYTTIQSAVNAAAAGDTIIVRDGTYTENVTVDKAVTLRAEHAQGATVTFSSTTSSIFTVSASNAVIDGFTINGSSTYTWYGIDGGTYCTFINNVISGVNTGINLGNYNVAANNVITSNGYGAVGQYDISNISAGILIDNGSCGNIVTGNTCTSTNGNSIGIMIFTVSGCCINGNIPVNSSNNTISNNTCNANKYGIYIQQSMYNTFYGNTLSNNQYGLYFRQNGDYTVTTGNAFYLNTVTGSTIANISYFDSNGNVGDSWNSPSPISYSYNGNTFTGYVGNYWGGYSGTDANGDGIGDTAYITQPYAGESDGYPLMAAGTNYLWGGSDSPNADFIVNTQAGTAPLTAVFTSASTGTQPLTYEWDFDNDGTIESTLPNPVHTFKNPGNYTVRLVATNASGSDTEIKAAFIHVKASGDPWTVGPAGSGADFTTIQSAIDTASAGQTIIVWDGNYSESPIIKRGVTNKSLIIRSQNGNSAVHIAGSFTIQASNVTVDGFTVSGGIITDGGEYANSQLMGVTIANNNVTGGTISLNRSSNGFVTNNSSLGIYLFGISQSATTGNVISGNTFHDAAYGIQLFQAGGNTFSNNVCLNNQYGISIKYSPNCVFYLNSIIGSTVADDISQASQDSGIYQSPNPVTYWYNGSQVTGYVGNYWSRYTGTDDNNDGIGNTPYIQVTGTEWNSGTEVDNYPLMFPVASYVETPQSPVAIFTSDVQSGIAGFTVRFINRSTGSATSMTYTWDFGDGTPTSSLANPTHAYNMAGTYNVSLTVTNSAGSDTQNRAGYITVTAPESPTSAFISNVQRCHAPFAVSFTDQSSGSPPLNWSWDFGDGGTSILQNPTHTYTASGVYTVSLTTTNLSGSNTLTKENYITVVPAGSDWYVDAAGGSDFTTIQEAVNSASSGDTIIVKDGTYAESITVDRSLTIKSEHGSSVAIINPPGGNNFTVTAANVTIDGFTLTQPGSASANTAILLNGSYANFTFKNNVINHVKNGIEISEGSSNGIISGNTISFSSATDGVGIYVHGDSLDGPANNSICNNTINLNNGGVYGIYLQSSAGNTVNNNTLIDPDKKATTKGLCIVNSDAAGDLHNTITGNIFEGIGKAIYLDGARANTFSGNTLYDCIYGVNLNYSGSVWGQAINNVFYLNTFSGIRESNVVLSGTGTQTPNYWNSTAPVSYWYNGVQVSGVVGNYWGSRYTGTDADNNGIGDTPYITRSGPEYDNYPLMFRADSYTVNGQAPIAVFISDVQSGNAGFTVTFNSQQSTGSAPLIYAWDFNNDNVTDSTAQNPAFVYNTSGTYTVKLTVTNSAGNNTLTRENYITVGPASAPPVAPIAAFKADITSGGMPLTVKFTDQSMNTPNSWAWDFGDGGTSTVQNPAHTYTNAGTYTVKLTAANAGGSDHVIKTGYITVFAQVAPVAAFSSDIISGKAPLTVNFMDRSTGSAPLSYAWDFGDGNTSTEQNPVHVYNTPRKYTVIHTVTNPADSSTITMTDYIDARPQIGWVVDAAGGGNFTKIQDAVDYAIYGESIIVKDGTYTENVIINKALSIKAEHLHGATVNPASGDIFTVSAHNVTLDGFTLTQSDTSTAYGIRISSDYYSCTFKNNDISNVGSGIGIYYNATNAHGNNTITNNNITLSNNGTYGIYLQKSSLNNINGNIIRDPYHRASTYGFYLTRANYASSDQCNTNTITRNTVDGTAYGVYTVNRCNYNLIYLNNFINLTTASVGAGGVFVNSTDNTWTSKPTEITYWYNGVQHTSILGNYWGNYYTGIDTDADGLGNTNYQVPGSTYTRNPQIDTNPLMSPNPTADFVSEMQIGEFPLRVEFSDRSFGAGTLSYAWDFGDGGNSTEQNPTYTYQTPGIYSVKLTVTNDFGTDEEIKTDYITVKPAVAASAGPNGSIDPSGDVTVDYGNDQSFTITPDANYHVDSLTVDGAPATLIDGAYTFTNVTANHTISVTFAINTFTITVTQGTHGTIAPDTVTVDYGSEKTFTISPSSGYHVAKVLVDGVSVGAVTSYTFTNITANHTISASFAANSSGGGGGGGSSQTLTPGTTDLRDVVDSSGKFTAGATALSADQTAKVTITAGVTGQTASGARLTQISITPATSSPAVPANFSSGGSYYNFEPSGAKFSENITITLPYDPALSDPFIAWYNTTTGQWERLTTISIDTVNHTVTAAVNHFTLFGTFALIKPAVTTPIVTSPVVTTPAPTGGTSEIITGTVTPAPTQVAVLTTVPAQPTTSAAATQNEPTPTNNWPLIIGIIAAVVILGLLLLLVIRRRRASMG